MSDNGGLSLVPPRNGIMHSQNLPLKKGKDHCMKAVSAFLLSLLVRVSSQIRHRISILLLKMYFLQCCNGQVLKNLHSFKPLTDKISIHS